MKRFFKKALSLALAALFTLGAVSVTAFGGLLPAVAEGESTLGAAAACTGHTLGTLSGDINLENADVDGNGKIDSVDYLYLKRGYLGTFDLSKLA